MPATPLQWNRERQESVDKIQYKGRPSTVVWSCDIHQRVDRLGWHWDLEMHIPGRSEPSVRTYEAPTGGQLPASVAQDLVAVVGKSILEKLIMWGGIQLELDDRAD
jgi:hypothetical protein